MKFSVLIPVYNGSATLERSIGSVLRQTTDPYELICCNDGSTDDSLEVLHKYAALDVYISGQIPAALQIAERNVSILL